MTNDQMHWRNTRPVTLQSFSATTPADTSSTLNLRSDRHRCLRALRSFVCRLRRLRDQAIDLLVM